MTGGKVGKGGRKIGEYDRNGKKDRNKAERERERERKKERNTERQTL